MTLINAKKEWKPIPLDFNLLAQEQITGFEELNDYELVSGSGSKEILTSKKKRAKSESEDVKPPKKKLKNEVTDVVNKKRKKEIDKKKAKRKAKRKAKAKAKAEVKTEPKPKKSREIVNFSDPAASVSKTDVDDLDYRQWVSLCVPEEIVRSLKDLRFTEPTEIQRLTLPLAIRDRLDILGAAETGSGKTLAFGIPIVAGLLRDLASQESGKQENGRINRGPSALILTPTRELAMQIKVHMTAILKYTPFKIAGIVGGLSVQKQERLLRKRPDIIVATPGRLWALLQEHFPGLVDLHETVKYVAIDETDRMVEHGHFMELQAILDCLKGNEETPKERQTFVFSATLTYVHPPPQRLVTVKQARQMNPQQKIQMLVSLTGLRKKHKVVDVTRKLGIVETLTEARINCDNLLEKDTYLVYFLTCHPGRTLVFTNSIMCCKRVRSLLSHLNLNPRILHANMQQRQRLKNLERFAAEEQSILLATDVASRGLDIKNIEHVLHYQVPRTCETYIHRSGRTARASKKGLSVMLVDQLDIGNYSRICKTLNKEKDLPLFPINYNLLKNIKQRVRLATTLESEEHKMLVKGQKKSWFDRKTAEGDLGSEGYSSTDEEELHDEEDKRNQIQQMRRQLQAMMSTPLKGVTPITKYPTAHQLDPTTTIEMKQDAIGALEKAQVDAKNRKRNLLKQRKLSSINKLKAKRKRKKKKKTTTTTTTTTVPEKQ